MLFLSSSLPTISLPASAENPRSIWSYDISSPATGPSMTGGLVIRSQLAAMLPWPAVDCVEVAVGVEVVGVGEARSTEAALGDSVLVPSLLAGDRHARLDFRSLIRIGDVNAQRFPDDLCTMLC